MTHYSVSGGEAEKLLTELCRKGDVSFKAFFHFFRHFPCFVSKWGSQGQRDEKVRPKFPFILPRIPPTVGGSRIF